MSSEHTGFPSLQLAFTIKVHVGEGNPVGDISTGQQFIHFQTPSGTIKSLPGFKPEVDAEIVFRGDWLYFDPDKSRARINFKGIAKTKSGARFSFYYAGIVTIDEAIGQIFAYSPDSKTIPFEIRVQYASPSMRWLHNNYPC